MKASSIVTESRRRRCGLVLVICASSVAALVLLALVPRRDAGGRIELSSAPFVLGGGGGNMVLQELSYNHAADRKVRRRHIQERALRGRHTAHRQSYGRAQQLDELNPDDPAAGKYEWRDPATLEKEKNVFDAGEYDSVPREWKGAGEPEENVMDYEGSTEFPDEPAEGTYKWRGPASLKTEENTFDTDEYASTPHKWKGAGEPEENVFENIQEDGAKRAQGGAKQASLARMHAKAERHDAQRAADALETERLEAAASARQQQVQIEKQELHKASVQKEQLENTLGMRDKQLASVMKQLLAEKSRVAQVEKEAQGHIWRMQHSPVNVLSTVYPQIDWKWHKNVEHLPSAIYDNLQSKPVLWHKYRPTKSHVLDYLSTKPVEWHAQQESYNALSGLPAASHEWRQQPEEVNVLTSLPDETHQWSRYEGEDNVLASLPSDAHSWQPQKEDKNVLESLSSQEHVWKKGPGVVEEEGQNVLDALPSASYAWKTGAYQEPTNVLETLPEDTQAWHKYTPEKSPIDQLPDDRYAWRGPGPPAVNPMDSLETKYTWKGPGPPAINPMDQLDDRPHEWKGYTPDKSPLDQLPDHHYTWKGPGTPAVNPMDQLNDAPHVWKGPGPAAVNPLDQLDGTPHVWKGYSGEGTNVLASLKQQPHVWQGPGYHFFLSSPLHLLLFLAFFLAYDFSVHKKNTSMFQSAFQSACTPEHTSLITAEVSRVARSSFRAKVPRRCAPVQSFQSCRAVVTVSRVHGSVCDMYVSRFRKSFC